MRLSSSVAGKVWRVCQGSLAMDHAFCAAASDMCLGEDTALPPLTLFLSLLSPPTLPDQLYTYKAITDTFFSSVRRVYL